MSFVPSKFLLTRPLRDVTVPVSLRSAGQYISTHTPLTGRDEEEWNQIDKLVISTHTPLTGRDNDFVVCGLTFHVISTHTPLTGRDFTR